MFSDDIFSFSTQVMVCWVETMSVTTQEITSVVNVPLRTSLFTGVTAERGIYIVKSIHVRYAIYNKRAKTEETLLLS